MNRSHEDLLSSLGPFFALAEAPHGATTLDSPDASAVWHAEVDRVHRVLAQRTSDPVTRRVAAASVHLTACSRLTGPALALLAAEACVPDLRPASLGVTGDDTGLSYATAGVTIDVGPGSDAVTEAFATYVLPGIETITALVESHVHLGPGVTASNAASALHNCCNAMDMARPDLARVARSLVPPLLRATWLGNGAEIRDDGTFRRRGCCLYYRMPDGGLCGDCVLG